MSTDRIAWYRTDMMQFIGVTAACHEPFQLGRNPVRKNVCG